MVSQEKLKQYRLEQHQRSLEVAARKMATTKKGKEQMLALWHFYTQKYLPNIAQCRKDAGYTQQELADAIKIGRNTLASYESNLVSPPLDVLSSIAKVLEAEISDLTRLNPDYNMTFEEFEKNIHNADMFIIVDDTENRLKEERLAAGYSLREFSSLVKMSAQAISIIEEGSSSSGLTRDRALTICSVLGKDINEIFNQPSINSTDNKPTTNG